MLASLDILVDNDKLTVPCLVSSESSRSSCTSSLSTNPRLVRSLSSALMAASIVPFMPTAAFSSGLEIGDPVVQRGGQIPTATFLQELYSLAPSEAYSVGDHSVRFATEEFLERNGHAPTQVMLRTLRSVERLFNSIALEVPAFYSSSSGELVADWMNGEERNIAFIDHDGVQLFTGEISNYYQHAGFRGVLIDMLFEKLSVSVDAT